VRAFLGRTRAGRAVSCAVSGFVAGCNDWHVTVEVCATDRNDRSRDRALVVAAVVVLSGRQSSSLGRSCQSQQILYKCVACARRHLE
jgi:hypothetical protein